MLLQHRNVNSDDAERRQTASLNINAQNHRATAKIGSQEPYLTPSATATNQRNRLSEATAQTVAILHNSEQFSAILCNF
jgi:hypothetical protein